MRKEILFRVLDSDKGMVGRDDGPSSRDNLAPTDPSPPTAQHRAFFLQFFTFLARNFCCLRSHPRNLLIFRLFFRPPPQILPGHHFFRLSRACCDKPTLEDPLRGLFCGDYSVQGLGFAIFFVIYYFTQFLIINEIGGTQGGS